MTDTTVIVGAGHGAGQLVATLKHRQYDGRIVLIGDEPYYPYQRPPLSKKFLAGELPAERLYFKPATFYDEPSIEVRLGSTIVSIDRDNRRVVDQAGTATDYDQLVLATGAAPRLLPLAGAMLPGVHYLRTIDDVHAIRDGFGPGARLAIVGAGYIGLEVAAVARGAGLDVTVVEMADRVMSRVVSEQLSEFYQAEHAARGVRILLNATLAGFGGESRVEFVELADGKRLPADLVVVGIGVTPRTELAAAAGLDVDNGIVVDSCCRTTDPSIFALGDCTNHPNALLGRRLRLESVQNALEQAKVTGANICGEAIEYAEVPWFWSDQYDLKLQIAGLSQGYDETVVRGDPATRSFACFYLHEHRVIAVDAVNSPRDFMQSKALIARRAEIPPETLADPGVSLKDLD